ncbi:MAG: DASS family sodium-coupled anion symporter [Deltaproteobacteria bacterium]|nr:DASS family sodium-coupled anion symporter [Deltaproteobacteria bacterium]
MLLKNRNVQLGLAVLLGLVIMLLPRPEGTKFEIIGDPHKKILAQCQADFKLLPSTDKNLKGYLVEAVTPGRPQSTAARLAGEAADLGLDQVRVEYVDGLSPTAQRFLAMLAFLIFLFVLEPIPLEITAICIGVLLILTGVTDVKGAWAPYMHPVVVFIMCCLIFAIALEKAGLTRRLGQAIARRAGDSVTKFTFMVAIGLGLASGVFHDAAAAAIGIATMLPLMRAAGIQPNTNTARFMMLSVPFACSCGGMGTLVGGGRNMVAAAFLKEFTGLEISFFDWIVFALPVAMIAVPLVVILVYFVYRPDPKFKLPKFDEGKVPWSRLEKKTVVILLAGFGMWLTKSLHGLDYSVSGMLTVTALVLFNILEWEDIHKHLEWGTALFIFGGGISLGLGMDASGAARYFANLFFPLVKGGGWLLLFAGVGLFGALVTNAMANVAAAALILPIVIPLAQLEGVDPRVLALCLGMSTSFAMLLVIGCPPNAIAYSYRQFRSFDLTKAGLVTTPVLLASLVGVVYIWWNILGLV